MDNRGNIYSAEGELLQNIETNEILKKSDVEGLVPLTPEQAEVAKNMVKEERIDLHSRIEREQLNELSLKVYGKAGEWRKLVKKGEFKEENDFTSGGKGIKVKRWHPITADEVKVRMEKILTDRETEAKKAAEEAVQKAKGEENEIKQEVSETGKGSIGETSETADTITGQ